MSIAADDPRCASTEAFFAPALDGGDAACAGDVRGCATEGEAGEGSDGGGADGASAAPVAGAPPAYIAVDGGA